MAEEAEAYAPPPMPRTRGGIDVATIVGLACGFGLVGAAIVLGGAPESFVNIPSVLIVIGGTLGVTTACFSLNEMARTLPVVARTFVTTHREASEAAIQVLSLADQARKQGVLALQNMVGGITHEPFLLKGINLVIDGTPGDEVEQIMRREMLSTVQRHNKSTSVLRKMAEFAPAMGLIGTLVGLVQMLGNLQDPASIGPSMAVALLTTFYGAVLANMVFLPLAAKLERNSAEEAMVSTIYVMGAASIGRQENPRRLEMMLNSFLPPAQRVAYFD